ncbi:hypothetical protein JCM10212_007089 [Sporobolomyces blumeae]
MNHLYHTLSPLVLLTSFLVSLLAFLAPTPIFADRVSLLSFSTNTTGSTSTSAKRWLPEADLDPAFPDLQRMVRRAKTTNAASSALTVPLHMTWGPLGACVSVDSGDLNCTSPTFTPIFVDLYSTNTSLPTSTADILPDQFPLAPTALFVSLKLVAVQFLLLVASSIAMHASKRDKLAAFAAKQPALRKVATGAGIVSLAVMLAATLALRSQLSTVVDWVEKRKAGTASLGKGFDQLFASIALEIVVLILLVAEAFTGR